MQEPIPFILMFLVLPLWVTAGFADWVCHRRTAIATTSGLRENLLHWLMFAEIGVGALAVMLLEINAAVLMLVLAVFLIHQLTVYGELRYSTLLRDVGPFEQMIHSFMEILPLVSLVLLALLAWPQTLALVGLGDTPPDWSLRLKEQPLPGAYLRTALALLVVFNVLPLAQETWACAWARPNRRARARTTARTPPNPEPK